MDMRWRNLALPLLLVLALLACKSPEASGHPKPPAVRTRDLSLDEARGGHTLIRHIGRTDDQLRERMDREREISAASTYIDAATAERVVAAAIAANQQKIERWMERGARRPNLVLDYSDPNDPIGRVLNRGAMGSVPCDHAIVVLRADGPRDYYVLTSYPECRP
jgi:Bacterial CdiA-CT RNAse A domain